jgi:hypothetical protein
MASPSHAIVNRDDRWVHPLAMLITLQYYITTIPLDNTFGFERASTTASHPSTRLSPQMIFSARQLATLFASALLTSALAGCAGVNEKMSATMGDYIPQWAGGLPPDAPPRPGTPQYEEFMREREHLRQMPAADREREQQAKTNKSSGLDPVH